VYQRKQKQETHTSENRSSGPHQAKGEVPKKFRSLRTDHSLAYIYPSLCPLQTSSLFFFSPVLSTTPVDGNGQSSVVSSHDNKVTTGRTFYFLFSSLFPLFAFSFHISPSLLHRDLPKLATSKPCQAERLLCSRRVWARQSPLPKQVKTSFTVLAGKRGGVDQPTTQVVSFPSQPLFLDRPAKSKGKFLRVTVRD